MSSTRIQDRHGRVTAAGVALRGSEGRLNQAEPSDDGYRVLLKSIDAGFEIWWGGKHLATHSFRVHAQLKPKKRKKHRK